MGTLSLDFSLWMLLAFFIGCIIGCIVHAIVAGARNNALAIAAAQPASGPHSWTHSPVDVSGTRAPPLAKSAKSVTPEPQAARPRASGPADSPEPAPEPSERPNASTGKPRPPQGLSAAPEGGGDDLQRISGIGAKIERTLNRLGIYRYDQIATWAADEIDWVDEHLNFRGRIAREKWIVQARLLAAGDEEAFTRQFGTGGPKD